MPNARRLEKISNRKKPATVGGKTIGSVNMPSTILRKGSLAFNIFLAAKIPRKKQTMVATIPVFSEIQSGLQSRLIKNSLDICVKIEGIKYLLCFIRCYKVHKIKSSRLLSIICLIIFNLTDWINNITCQIIRNLF